MNANASSFGAHTSDTVLIWHLHCKKKSVKFTVKNWQLWLPELYRKKYGNNILGFTVLT